MVVAHEFATPHHEVRKQTEVAAASLCALFNDVRLVVLESAIDVGLDIRILEELSPARCTDAAVQLCIVVAVALHVLFEARHAAKGYSHARLVVHPTDKFECAVGQVLCLVDDDETARILELCNDASSLLVEASTVIEAEFCTEFVEESLRGVAVVSFDENYRRVRLGKFLEGGGLAAACVAREHPANLVSENKAAELLDGLESACLHDAVVRLELGAFGFGVEEVLCLVADGVNVARVAALEEVAEGGGAYAEGLCDFRLRGSRA